MLQKGSVLLDWLITMRLQASLPRVFRFVAVFFLLFTAVDLTVPQFCSEETGGLPIAKAAQVFSKTDFADELAAVSTSDSQGPVPSDQPSHEEDCFCCCAHVVPGVVHCAAAIADMSSHSQVSKDRLLPSPPLRGPFHPPRLI